MKYPEVKHLYKYYAYNENALAVLINKKIWAANPKSFNDPFDCNIKFSPVTSKESLEKFAKRKNKEIINYGNYRQGFIKISKEIEDELNNETRIFSMSSEKDNILMWAHYADEHKGFCIGFARQPDNMLGGEVTHKVKYKYEYPEVKVLDSDGNINIHYLDRYLIKAKDWKYEQEWRIVYGKDDPREPILPEISSIIFGLRMPEQNKNTIRNILTDQSDIRYRQAEKKRKSI